MTAGKARPQSPLPRLFLQFCSNILSHSADRDPMRRSNSRPTASSSLNSRKALVGMICAALTWLVLSKSLAAYLADVAPQASLWLNPRQPEALLQLADEPLSLGGISDRFRETEDNNLPDKQKNTAAVARAAPSSAETVNETFSLFNRIDENQSVDLLVMRDRAISALMSEPLNARALRLLGQIYSAENDNVDTMKFMDAAVHLSLHQAAAASWLLTKSAQTKNFKATIYYADVLLRTNPQTGAYVFPFLARLTDEKQSRDLITAELSNNPPWRDQFLQSLPSEVRDARTPLSLLLALRAGPVRPSPADVVSYLDVLVSHKFYELAYYTWLQFLPPDQLRTAGLLFDGSFELPPSGAPFDWAIPSGSGFSSDIIRQPDNPGEHALLVEFQDGRVDYRGVKQLVMLAPGTYQFTGEYKGKLDSPRGLTWRVICADNNTKIGESVRIDGVALDWRSVTFNFTVPATECRAQYVQLNLDARMASEKFISGSIMFDKLRILRAMASSIQQSGGTGMDAE